MSRLELIFITHQPPHFDIATIRAQIAKEPDTSFSGERGHSPWAQAPSGNGGDGIRQAEPLGVKPRSAARGGTAPWAQAPSGNGGDGIRQAEPLGVKPRSAARGGTAPWAQAPSGKNGGGIRRFEPRRSTRRRPNRPTGVQRHRWSLIRILAQPGSNRQKNGGGGNRTPVREASRRALYTFSTLKISSA